MSNTKHAPTGAEGAADTTPSNLIGLELAVGKLVTGWVAKYGPVAAQAGYKAWQGEEGAWINIDSSWKEGDHYYITLSFVNLTTNGMYIEDLGIDNPQDIAFDVSRPLPPVGGLGDPADRVWSSPAEFLPILLSASSAESKKVVLRIAEGVSIDGTTLAQYHAITVKVRLSILDKPEPVTMAKVIRIRDSGPGR